MGDHDPWVPDLDLGNGHSLIWTTLPANEGGFVEGQHYGAIIRHPRGGAKEMPWLDDFLGAGICEGGIAFDTPTAQAYNAQYNPPGKALWQVQSWDPLTISPSVLCDCGDHGFIRNGRWVPA